MFYEHLPRAIAFMQDDPPGQLWKWLLTSSEWLSQSVSSFKARRAQAEASKDTWRKPWQLEPCGCQLVRERFDRSSYGGYRPTAWWMRTFFAQFRGANALPEQLLWPQMATFVMPSIAIRVRSRQFYALHARLTEVPAPLKFRVPRIPTDRNPERTAKWANFGPWLVDLGPAANTPAADRRRAVNGMDLAQNFERSIFRVFDPALTEAPPPFPECFSRRALANGLMRCTNETCPTPERAVLDAYGAGGCMYTDKLGRSNPPGEWAFGGRHYRGRCMGAGCEMVSNDSSAWADGRGREVMRIRRQRR